MTWGSYDDEDHQQAFELECKNCGTLWLNTASIDCPNCASANVSYDGCSASRWGRYTDRKYGR